MSEIHAFEARRISQENYKVNVVMDEIFKTIEENAKLGMFYAEFVGGNLNALNEIEMSTCIKRLKTLSYKVIKTNTGIEVEWGKR